MGHSLNSTSLNIDQNLVIDDDTFNPGYILISDEKGNVSWKNPTAYIDNTDPLDRFIGELYGGGVVVAVWREQRDSVYEKCLIASVRDYTEPFSEGSYYYWQWSSISSAIGLTARSNTFGASNSWAISAQGPDNAGTPPNLGNAANKCLAYVNQDLGIGSYTDWYLPSTFEINCLANNAGIVDRVIDKYSKEQSISLYDDQYIGTYGGAAKMSLVTNSLTIPDYWTSTEFNSGSAWYLKMATGGALFATASKSTYNRVRPFRLETKRWSGSEWIILDPASRRKTGKVLVTHDKPVVEGLGPSIVANITAMEQSLSNTVIYATYSQIISQDLSQYDHIWDIGVDITYALNNQLTTIMGATYTAYLQQGGAMFILGENASFNPRNTDVANFINSLGGGTVAPPSTTNSSTLTVGSQFLLANTTNTVSFNAGGVFASIGTGTAITSPSTVAAVWQKGSLSAAPNACIVSILDINWLSSEWTNRNSSQFAANVSKILNQL